MARQGMARVTVGLGVLALVLGACGGKKTPAAPQLTNKLIISGSEYRFDLDKASLNQGTAQVTFKNTGREMHMAIWARLKAGKTFKEFQDALPKGEEAAFGLIEDSNDGAPGILSPGNETILTTNLLKAGTYALVCFLPAPDGAPHFAKGMVSSMEVAPAGTPAPSPFTVKADAEVSMTDYSFGALPEALTKGKGTIRFSNKGKQPHEATIVRLEPGKTFADVDKYFSAFDTGKPPTGPPPGHIVGGFFSIDPGSDVWLTVNFQPGNYAMVCGEETDDGKTHEDLGMKVDFTVA